MSLPGTLLIVMAVATYRVTRLVVGDTIWEGWRDKFKQWAYVDPENHVWRKIPGRPWLTFWRGKLADLVTCPFCISVWIAGFMYVALKTADGWDGTSWVEHGVAWMAVAGGAIMIWNLVEIEVHEPEHIVLEEES